MVKYKLDWIIKRYKAKLVAKGYTQSYRIDYQETFTPVIKTNNVATNLNRSLKQFDVKNAFFNGRDIYGFF